MSPNDGAPKRRKPLLFTTWGRKLTQPWGGVTEYKSTKKVKVKDVVPTGGASGNLCVKGKVILLSLGLLLVLFLRVLLLSVFC